MRPNCVYGAICTSALVPMRGAPWAEELARAPGGKKLGKQRSPCCPAPPPGGRWFTVAHSISPGARVRRHVLDFEDAAEGRS